MDNHVDLVKELTYDKELGDREFTPDEIRSILKAGLILPSSEKNNSCRFLVVEDKEVLGKLAKCRSRGAAFLAESALAVVVMAYIMEDTAWVEHTSVASVLMRLRAAELDIGSRICRVRGGMTENHLDSAEYIRRLFDMPYYMETLAVIGFGGLKCSKGKFEDGMLKWDRVYTGEYRTE